MKIILLGKGYFGNKILTELNKMDNVEIYCYNSDIFYKNIDLTNVNWVIISTPNEFHFEQAEYFISNEINIFLEKPGTLSYNSLLYLINCAKDKGIIFYVDDIMNYNLYELSNKFIWKKYSNNKYGNIIDRLSYHHMYLLYNENSTGVYTDLNITKINRYNAEFSFKLDNNQYYFDYSLENKEYEHNIIKDNKKSLYYMLISLFNNKLDIERNHIISLYATKLTEQLKFDLYGSVAVVGGGIYGCTTAIKLKTIGYNVVLYEKNNDILEAASGINQFRLHRGYHYPRSLETIQSCKNDEPSFSKYYFDSIVKPKVKHLYAISEVDSMISSNEYINILNENNLEWKEEKKINGCDLVISVDENLYDADVLRDICNNRLFGCGINVLYNTKWENDFIKDYNKVFYATYANLNEVTGESVEYQFEICEKPVVKLPEKYKDLSLVIMDGPFLCFDPYGNTDYHLAGNVVHCIHATNIGIYPIVPKHLKKYLNKGIIRKPKYTNFEKYIQDAKKYLPNIEETEHIGSMYTIRTVLPYEEETDTRPTIVRKISDNEFVIFSGKVVNCVYAAEKAIEMI